MYVCICMYPIKLPYVKVYNLIYKNYINNAVETGRKLKHQKTSKHQKINQNLKKIIKFSIRHSQPILHT